MNITISVSTIIQLEKGDAGEIHDVVYNSFGELVGSEISSDDLCYKYYHHPKVLRALCVLRIAASLFIPLYLISHSGDFSYL